MLVISVSIFISLFQHIFMTLALLHTTLPFYQLISSHFKVTERNYI